MNEAKYTALVPWFGAKRSLAEKIVAAVGPHRCYWEPFCGSLAVLLNKPVAGMETVNDLHRDLVNLARVVRDEELVRRLHWRLLRTLPAEALFRESVAVVRAAPADPIGLPPSVTAERAYHYLLTSWLGMNGVAGTSGYHAGFARRFSSKGGAPGLRWVGVVDSLPFWHERLRAVMVLQTDGIEVCERIEDREGTVIYADPPYLLKGASYLHDFKREDHERLAAALARFKLTRVVVSYYAHPELARLYPDWHRQIVTTNKAMVSSGKRTAGKVEAPELLLCNQPFPKAPKKEPEHGRGEAGSTGRADACVAAAVLQDAQHDDAERVQGGREAG